MESKIKRKLFLDFDNCISASISKICDLYNLEFANHPKFKFAKWYLCESYNLIEVCPLANCDKIYSYFNQPEFFVGLEFVENALEVITRLSEAFEIIVVSLGFQQNLELKELWLKENLKCMTKFIGCDLDKYHSKSHIDMSEDGSVFVDDDAHNLETSNCGSLVCFGDLYEWNKRWKNIRMFNWTDLERFLME